MHSRLRVQSRTPRLASPNSKTAKGVPKSEVAREGRLRPSPAASGSAEGAKATRSQLRADVQRSRTATGPDGADNVGLPPLPPNKLHPRPNPAECADADAAKGTLPTFRVDLEGRPPG